MEFSGGLLAGRDRLDAGLCVAVLGLACLDIGEIHFPVAHHPGAGKQLASEPHHHEQHQPDIGGEGADPVDLAADEGLVVLPEHHHHAQAEGEQGAEWEVLRDIRQFRQVVAMEQVSATEAVVADGDAKPGNEAEHAGSVQQPQVQLAGAEQEAQQAQAGDRCSCQQRPHRGAAARHPGEYRRRLALQGEAVEHARGGVHARVAGGQH
ncbi:hypothetical protein WR25_02888 [Diploscapter pachys]|uniref:Uncharacterized protein n=1 Tax=Diploscapter pachys TaxID=2018661 RepID=A0A2A2K8Q4_9BILA|nr:hypothetical protein WR25_02888 [Diploscapter pachys]